VCHSETAAVACGESSNVGRCNSSQASLAKIRVSPMLDLCSETSLIATDMYIFGLIGLQGGRYDYAASCGIATLLAEA